MAESRLARKIAPVEREREALRKQVEELSAANSSFLKKEKQRKYFDNEGIISKCLITKLFLH